MTTPRAQQFRVDLPDGLVVERLPVGLVNGHWHLSFVCFGVDFSRGDPPRFTRFLTEFRSRVVVTAPTGDLEYRGGDGGGSEAEQRVGMRFLGNGVTALEVTYLHDGSAIEREVIDLTEGDLHSQRERPNRP